MSRVSFVLLWLLFAPASLATECHIQLKMGLLISPDHIRVMEQGRTQVQINNNKDLFIRGEQIDLTPEQQILVEKFSLGLRKELPEIVAIAIDSMELGFGSLDKFIKSIGGTDTAQGIEAHFDELQGGLIKRFARSGDNFYIAPQGLDELDDFFQEKVTSQIRDVVTGSLTVLLEAMGEAYQSSESNVEGQRVDLGERVDLISKEVERSLNYNAERLAEKAEAFCQRFRFLDKAERKLQKQIPSLIKYDILANQNISDN